MVTGLPRALLRIEGLAVAVAAVVLFGHVCGSWWLFVLWIVPDVSAVAYVFGRRIGAIAYDVVHLEAWPIALGVFGQLEGRPVVTGLALIWLSHIGIDRALGYGLKYASGFTDTHLGRMGRQAS